MRPTSDRAFNPMDFSPLRACPAGLDIVVPVSVGPDVINVRVRGPSVGGLPLMTWQGGRNMETEGWKQLRLCLALLQACRELGDPAALAALAAYPRIGLMLTQLANHVAIERGRLVRLADRQPRAVAPTGERHG